MLPFQNQVEGIHLFSSSLCSTYSSHEAPMAGHRTHLTPTQLKAVDCSIHSHGKISCTHRKAIACIVRRIVMYRCGAQAVHASGVILLCVCYMACLMQLLHQSTVHSIVWHLACHGTVKLSFATVGAACRNMHISTHFGDSSNMALCQQLQHDDLH